MADYNIIPFEVVSLSDVPVVEMTDWRDSVRLVLNFEGATGTKEVPDLSGEGHILTQVGTAQLKPYVPGPFEGQGAFFGGDDISERQYLSIPDSSDWDFGSGDFTIDTQVMFPILPMAINYKIIYCQRVDDANKIFLAAYNISDTQVGWYLTIWESGGVIHGHVRTMDWIAGQWYHIALVRDGNTWSMYKDGVLQGATSTSSITIPNFATPLVIGTYDGTAANNFEGHLREYRVSKGLARWTSGFTPPNRLSADSDTQLLLHFDHNVNDSSASGHAVTNMNEVEFMNGCGLFNGVDQYLTVSDSEDWNFGSGDFTIETFINFRDTYNATGRTNMFWSVYQDDNNRMHMWFNPSSGSIRTAWATGGVWTYWDAVVPGVKLNTWTHFALEREGNDIYYCVDGVRYWSAYFAGSMPNYAGVVSISSREKASGRLYYINAALAEYRVSKGTARYTGDYNIPLSPFVVDSSTKLLIHFNGNIEDESATGHTITNVNGVAVNAAVFGRSAAWLDGNSDYYTIPDSDDWNIVASATDDWTIGLWVKHNDHVGDEVYITQREDGSNNWMLFHRHGSGLKWQFLDGGVDESTGFGGEITDSNWHHVVLCKVGNDYGVYLDGVQVAYKTTTAVATFTGSIYIGWLSTGATYFDGYMDELRIRHNNVFNANPVVGMTDTIDVPTSPYSTEDNTKLLVHFDTQDVSADFNGRDFCHIPTFYNNAKIHGDGSSLNEVSLGSLNMYSMFNGTSYLSVPDHADWTFGTGDFTVECWVMFDEVTVANYQPIIQQFQDNFNIWELAFYVDRIRFYCYIGSQIIMHVHYFTPVLGHWYHIAAVRDGNDSKVFIDGVMDKDTGGYTGADLTDLSASLYIGRHTPYAAGVVGGVDEVRISKGVARYTSDFTPSTVPFTSDVDTKLLLHLDNNVTDSGNTVHTVTNSSATFDAHPRWGTGCLELDGVDDYLTIPNNQDWTFGSLIIVDRTIDLWVLHKTHSATQMILQHREDSTNQWVLYHSHGNGYNFKLTKLGSVIIEIGFGGETTDSVWHHIALVRLGQIYAIYVDGQQVGYVSDSDSDTFAGLLNIGYNPDAGAQDFDGYMDAIRFAQFNTFGANPNVGLSDTINVPTQAPTATLDILRYDSPSIAEYADRTDGLLNTSTVFDIIAVSEWQYVVDLVVEVGILQETLIVADVITDMVMDTTLDVSDSLSTAEGIEIEKKTWWDEAVLVMNFNGANGNKGIVNEGSPLHVITLNGTAELRPAPIGKFGNGAWFNGKDSYLSIPDHNDFYLGANDFTFELWYYPTEMSGSHFFFTQYDASNQYIEFYKMYSGALQMNARNGVGWVFRYWTNTQPILTPNRWYHIAFVRNGNNAYIFVDGVAQSVYAYQAFSATPTKDYTSAVHIGDDGFTLVAPCAGSMDEIRLSNTARYTTNFTTQTIPFTNDGNTKLLLHFDGKLTDSSGTGHTVTSVNNVEYGTAPYGRSALWLDGNSDYVSIPDSTDWNFLEGEFGVELWFKADDVTDRTLVDTGYGTGIFIELYLSTLIKFSIAGAHGVFTTPVTLQTNTWYHLVCQRVGNSMYLAIDGAWSGNTGGASGYSAASSSMNIGRKKDGTNHFGGYIAGLKITKGRYIYDYDYAEGFTPPASPVKNDDYTKLLLNFNTLDLTKDFTSGFSDIPIFNGTAQLVIGKQNFNGCGIFDGSSTYLTVPDHNDWDILTKTNATVECWFQWNAAGSDFLFSHREDNDNRWDINGVSSGKLGLVVRSGGVVEIYMFPTDRAILDNDWHHIAVIKVGSDWGVYIDGKQEAYISSSFSDTFAGTLYIGTYASNPASYTWNGALDEVRITHANDYSAAPNSNKSDTITVPTSPHTSDVNTKLLLHLDGNVTDSGNTVHTVTNVGGVTFGATKWGMSCLWFDGDSDYLTYSDSTRWDVCASATDDWTIDLWIKHSDHVGTEHYVEQYEDGSNHWRIYHADGSGLNFKCRNTAGTVVETGFGGEITDTNWHHIVLCKVGSKYAIYKDGIQVNYTDDSDTDTFYGNLNIGAQNGVSNYFYGYMDSLRIVKMNYFGADPVVGLTDTITVPVQEPVVEFDKRPIDTVESLEYVVIDFISVDLDMNVNEATSIVENIEAQLSVGIDVYDTLSTAESIVITNPTIYLPIVSENISVAENVAAYLDVLNVVVLEPFSVLITEAVTILDLVVELGVVMEPINVLENASAELSVLFLSADDNVSIEENIDADVDVLYMSVSDSVSIQENIQAVVSALYVSVSDAANIAEYVQLLDLIVELLATDDVAIIESAVLSPDPLYSAVEDNVTVAENIQVNLDVLTPSVSEDVLITESTSVIDLVVEVGVVPDFINIVEDAYVSVGELLVSVYDGTSISEYVQLLDIIVELSVLDAVVIQENINVSMAEWLLSISDTVSTSEGITLLLDQLYLYVVEPFSVLITEHVDIIDLVVELGVVAEAINPIESITVMIPELNISESDDVGTEENVTAVLSNLFTFIYEDIAIVENVNMHDIIIELAVWDFAGVLESVAVVLPFLLISVEEDITVTEGLNMLDEVVEVSGADNVSVVENASASLSALYMSVSDTIFIEEYGTVHDIIIELGIVYEDIAITEVVITHDIIIELGIVSDSLAVSENLDIYLLALPVIADDSINIVEDISVEVPSVSDFNISVSEDVSILETATLTPSIDINVNEQAVVVESIDLYLDVLNVEVLEPFNVVITESTSVIDLVVEVGIVMEAINLIEGAVLLLTELNIDVSENIGMAEAVGVYLSELFIDIYDGAAIIEYLNMLDTIIELGVFTDVGVSENIESVITVLFINESDTVSLIEWVLTHDLVIDLDILVDIIEVNEAISVVVTELTVDISDDILVTDVAVMNDLVIELGVVADTVVITDEIGLYIDILSIAISDPLTVQESASVVLSALNIAVFEGVSIQEWASVLDITIELVVSEPVTAQDYLVSLHLDTLNIFVIQPMMILITEHADVVDLVVEVGVVAEYNTIAENIEAVLDALYVSIYEDITAVEYATVHDIVIEMPLVEDTVGVVEAIGVAMPELFVSVGEGIAVIEQEVVAIDILSITVNDITVVTEYATIHDIIVELFAGEDIVVQEAIAIGTDIFVVSVYDEVSIQEYLIVFDIIIELGVVYEDISVVEWAGLFSGAIFLMVYEDITVEDIVTDIYMGLSFEVAEQSGGIQIVTVNW